MLTKCRLPRSQIWQVCGPSAKPESQGSRDKSLEPEGGRLDLWL